MARICYLWSVADVKYGEANWTWDECQIVEELCKTWGDANHLWFRANWIWSKCSGSLPPPPPPPPPITASVINYGVDATTLVQPWLEEPWNPYREAEEKARQAKRKRLIKLICKIKGEKFDEEKEVKDIDISIEDVKLVVKKVANIDLDLKLEE